MVVLSRLLILGTFCFGLVSPLRGQPPADQVWDRGAVSTDGHYERRVLDQLWNARLYATADSYCTSNRALQRPEGDGYALWTIWWMEGLGRQRLDDPDQAEAITQKLEELHARFLNRPEKHRRALWIQLQRLRCQWMQGAASLATFQAVKGDDRSREAALAGVRQLLEDLDQLQQEVQDLLAISARRAAKSDVPKSEEVQSLANELLLLRVDTFHIRCQCYPFASPDRIAAASQMMKVIADAKVRIDPNWPGFPKLLLAQARAATSLQEFDEAIALCAAAMDRSSERESLGRIKSLLSEIYRRQKKWELAAKALTDGPNANGPELALSHLELQLSQLTQLADKDQARNDLLQSILKAKTQIGEQYGIHWLRRAEVAITNAVDASEWQPSATTEPSGVVDLIRTEARQLLAAGNWQAARDKLLLASSNQSTAAPTPGNDASTGNGSVAMSLAMEGAAIEQKFGSEEKAQAYYRDAALLVPSETRAPDSHLMACWLGENRLSQLEAEATPTAQSSIETRDGYRAQQVTLLQEHLQRWPQSPTSNQCRPWLAAHLAAMGERSQMTDWWRKAIMGPEVTLEAINGAIGHATYATTERKSFRNADAQTFAQTMDALQRSKMDKEDSLAAMKLLTLLGCDRRWEWLDQRPQYPTKIDSDIARKPLTATSPLANFAQSVEQLLTDPGSTQTSLETLESLAAAHPSFDVYWLPLGEAMLERLLYQPPAENLAWRQALQRIAQWTETQIPTSFDSEWVRQRAMCQQWVAMEPSLERTQLQKQLEEIRTQGKKDPRIAIDLATMSLQGDQAELEKSLQVYRQIGKGSQLDSEIWIEARMRSVQCLMKLQKTQEAEKLLQLIRATKPDLSDLWQSRMKQIATQTPP